MAARDAATVDRADRQLYTAVYAAGGNRYLVVVLAAVQDLRHDLVARLSDDLGTAERTVGRHRVVAVAVQESSTDRAERAIRDRIRATVAAVRRSQRTD